MLICAQSGRNSGLEKETDPASSARSDKKGIKDNNNRLLGIVNKFCIRFGTKSRIIICGGLDSDCTVVTLHRIATFRVQHLNSAIEQTRGGGGGGGGYNITSITIYTAYINTPIPFFSGKHSKQAGF